MKSPAGLEPRRSALTGRHSPPLNHPSVAIIVPIFNEIAHIDRLAVELAAQDYAGPLEIHLVDGGSNDGTRDKLRLIASADPRFRVLDNPRRLPAAALNIAIAASQSDIVARLDAHARYAPDNIRRAVETLLATGAGGVGGHLLPGPGTSLVGRAIAAAHISPLGVGVAPFRREHCSGWVETVWNGCYWRHVIEQVGPLREDLPRAEDNDLNARIRGLGYGLYLSPAIRASYQPRATLAGLWHQHLANGLGVTRALWENPAAVRPRHLAPLALLLALLLPLLAALVWPPAAWLTAAAALAYASILVLAVLLAARHHAGPHLVLLPPALAAIHIGYGIGELMGLAASARRLRASRHIESAA